MLDDCQQETHGNERRDNAEDNDESEAFGGQLFIEHRGLGVREHEKSARHKRGGADEQRHLKRCQDPIVTHGCVLG